MQSAVGVILTIAPTLSPVLLESEERVQFIKVSGGDAHFLALTSNSEMFSAGDNYFGQLCQNNTISTQVPTKIKLPFSERVKMIKAGSTHSIAITENNQIWTCGDPESYGQGYSPLFMFQPIEIPKEMQGQNITHVDAGSAFTVVLTCMNCRVCYLQHFSIQRSLLLGTLLLQVLQQPYSDESEHIRCWWRKVYCAHCRL